MQYLHTLGFMQMEIKPLATKRGPKSALKSQRLAGDEAGRVRHVSHPTRINGGPSPSSPSSASSSDVNTLYFHKSHQGEHFIVVESRTQTLTQFIPSIFKKVESWCARLPFKNLFSTPKSTRWRCPGCCKSVRAELFLTWLTSHLPKRITPIAFSTNAITSK